MKKEKKSDPYLVVYFDDTLTSFQIIRPKTDGPKELRFDGNWKALASGISGGNYFKYEIR